MSRNRLLAIYDAASQPIEADAFIHFLQGVYLRSIRLGKEFVDFCFVNRFSKSLIDDRLDHPNSFSNPFGSVYPILALTQFIPNLDSVFIVNESTELGAIGARYGDSIFPDVNALIANRSLSFEMFGEMDSYFTDFGSIPYLRAPENLNTWAIDFLREKSNGKIPVTINCKSIKNSAEGNSKATEWVKFANAAAKEFPVKFFLLCSQSEIDPVFRNNENIVIVKDYGTGIAEDLALIENASLHTGVTSGPAQMAVFSERPFFITNADGLKSLDHYQGSLIYNGAYMRHSFGSEFQRLYTQDAEAGFLLEIFREYWKMLETKRLDSSKYVRSAAASIIRHLGSAVDAPFDANEKNEKTGAFFSVLVPTYNQAGYLKETLDSLLAQTYADWEAVVIDDGSTDETPEVMLKYAELDPRIRLFHKENGGVSTALNLGLKHAKGEWVCWLSSDDLFEPYCLDTYKNAIEENPETKFFHAQHYELLEPRKEKITPVDRTAHIPPRDLQTITFFNGNYVHGISVCGAREVFNAVGEFDEGLLFAQDVDMWMRISSKFETKFLSDRVAVTRVHDEATTSVFSEGGDFDYGRFLINFLNTRPFEDLFPHVDLKTGEGAGIAIRGAVELALNANSMAYKGPGYRPALLEKLAEWISGNCNEQVKSALAPQLTAIADFVEQSGYPQPLIDSLQTLRASLRVPYRYIPFNPLNLYFERFIDALKRNDQSLVAPLAIYFSKINRKMPLRFASSFDYYPQLIEILDKLVVDFNSKSVRSKLVIPESANAHKWLDGLQGIEVGPSSHNPFGLNTVFVGMRDEIYQEEQIRLTKDYVKLDIEALADEIPLPDESHDFVLSSHVIEHCPNFIKTMIEWFRLVRKGGYIYMITPLRDSAPSDRGKPVTTWEHLLDDYARNQIAEMEPEAGQLGHCHYHVFEIEEMKRFISDIFGDSLTLVDSLEKDDKDGLGFTLVYRKEKANGEAFPRKLGSGQCNAFATIRSISQNQDIPGANLCMITYNRIEFTRQAIASLHEVPPGADFKLTVIDNASEDGTREYLEGLKELGIIDNLILLDENIGVAKAANLGWSLVPEAKYFVKIDNDIVFKRENWLGELIETAEKLPDFGILGYNFEPVSYPLTTMPNGIELREKTEGNLGGACFLVSPRTKKLIGDFCEEYGLYGEEDADYCYRATLSGLRIAYMKDEDAAFHLPSGKAAVIDFSTLEANDAEELASHRQYRLWKDERRRENVASGLFHSNLFSYLRREKSPYYESSFVKEYKAKTGKATPAIESQPPAKINSSCLVSIITPVFNKLELTRQCVESLYSIPAGAEFELIIIDNGSSDGTKEYLDGLAKTHHNFTAITNESNLGFAKASNQGIAKAKGKYLLLLNNDTVVTENWLGAMVAEAETDAKVGIVGSLLLYPDRETVQHAGVLIADNSRGLFAFHMMMTRKIQHAPTALESRDMPAVTGACMLIKREVIESCGPLDDCYRNGYEDIDFCFKAAAAGFKTRYCGASRVIHYESMSPTRHDRDEENHIIFTQRWRSKILDGIDTKAVYPFLAEYFLRFQIRTEKNPWEQKLGLIAHCGAILHPDEVKEILAGFGINGDSSSLTGLQVDKVAAKFIEMNVGV